MVTTASTQTVSEKTRATKVDETQKLTLRSYAGPIEEVDRLTPCYSDTPLAELQRRYREDGVLWVKGLLDRNLVQKFRGDYLSFVNNGSKILKPGTDPVDGIFSGEDPIQFLQPGAVRVALGLSDDGAYVQNAMKSHNWETYLQFKHKVGKALEPFVGRLCEFKDSWCLPRSLLRSAVPQLESTPVHYDQIFLRAGPPTSITAWIPIGDVEVDGGGLIYLDRSHLLGQQYEEEFSKKNQTLSQEERISAFNRNMEKGGWLDRDPSRFGHKSERRWLVGNYEAGDVVFHTPFTIHAGAMNQSKSGRIRVSTDLRFVDRTKPYDQRWEKTAYGVDDPNLARGLQFNEQWDKRS
ncbi:hypothetical protein CLAIMM_14935 [Cladophialophora immunda]|nr:hypothetical protein CLAIMM_14935 [Cladophialophora immunda]